MADRKRQASGLPRLKPVAWQRTNPNAMSSDADKVKAQGNQRLCPCSDSLACLLTALLPPLPSPPTAGLYKCGISGSHFSPVTRGWEPPSELAFTMLFASVEPRKQNSSALGRVESSRLGRLQHANAINTPADKPEMESCRCWPMAAQHVPPKLAGHFSTGLDRTGLAWTFPSFFPCMALRKIN